jgi:hypothetical protein
VPIELIAPEIWMMSFTDNLAQEIQRRSLTSVLLRRLAAVLILAGAAVSCTVSAYAQELPPLRENRQKLNNIISALRADAEIRFITPGWDLRIPFDSMVVAVLPPVRLANWELMDAVADTQALADYMKTTIETRLAELGVSDEIALHMTTAQLQKPTADCGELRMLLALQADELELDGRSVLAVTVRIHSWTGAGLSKQNGKAECLGDKGPPWSGFDEKMFLVDRGDRDRALAETQKAILTFVDGALLTRLLFSNDTARSTVVLWLKEDN